MTKNPIKIILSTLLILSCVFAQRETVGVEFNQHDRQIDLLRTKSNIFLMSYRKDLPTGTRIAASLGLDYVKLFDSDFTTDPVLKSTNQIFIQLEGLQKLYFTYFKGAVQFYSIKGNAIETTDGYSEVLHDNIYRIFEFPLGAGITFPINSFDFYVGANKAYFYGFNEKEIIINNSGNETNLGSGAKRTFQTDVGFGAEVTVLYHFAEKLDFEINFTKYTKDDYSVRLSVWGPLKRMLLID